MIRVGPVRSYLDITGTVVSGDYIAQFHSRFGSTIGSTISSTNWENKTASSLDCCMNGYVVCYQ